MHYLVIGLLVILMSAVMLSNGHYYLGEILFAIGIILGIKGNRKYYKKM